MLHFHSDFMSSQAKKKHSYIFLQTWQNMIMMTRFCPFIFGVSLKDLTSVFELSHMIVATFHPRTSEEEIRCVVDDI